ncbi:hypothetical protein [Marinomonas sp. GJ51-6]|uniref:hypothetical protein n=1 Tax=Marinomonas sp. GJ51-6 TaxID=2992802 RepID=UPI0029352EF0|nr:hypothetical protein [Marinomonas sp. GJ51-6]WOD08286.1 hypothetical protein ONZ50_03915 [Marinomonas sp. GJ51-6]
MSGCIIERANVSIPLLGSELDSEGITKNEEIANHLKMGLREFCSEIEIQKLNKRVN